jgi:hypothetical protein
MKVLLQTAHTFRQGKRQIIGNFFIFVDKIGSEETSKEEYNK